jgi:hypothetical protein
VGLGRRPVGLILHGPAARDLQTLTAMHDPLCPYCSLPVAELRHAGVRHRHKRLRRNCAVRRLHQRQAVRQQRRTVLLPDAELRYVGVRHAHQPVWRHIAVLWPMLVLYTHVPLGVMLQHRHGMVGFPPLGLPHELNPQQTSWL